MKLNQKTAKRLRRLCDWRDCQYQHNARSMQTMDPLRTTLELTPTCGKGIYRRMRCLMKKYFSDFNMEDLEEDAKR